jgi:D-3-phosphoglycerate dehydrogenase
VKVLIADRLDPAAAARLREAGHEVVERSGLDESQLIEALRGCAALLVRSATKVTARVLGEAQDLAVVARAGTGLDNIDVKAARARGVTVLNTPAANAVAVTELVFGLLLALERHLVQASADLRAGRWEKTRYMGRELSGQRLGLVGFGRIGREVATRARAFGMEVRAFDPLLAAWPAGYEWVRRATLDELLPEVDYLSLHLPFAEGTRGMIGARELALMRPEAVLVNCARGGIVDEEALLAALESGRLRAACLDVFATEPPGAHPLLSLPNVIATPHLGASTHGAQARAGVEAAELVIDALARTPR